MGEPPGQNGFAAGEGLRAGSRVAGYVVEGPVGRGGMAVVFRAHDERLGRTVALTILVPALAADDAFRQRFISESRAAAAVDDPHIIPVSRPARPTGSCSSRCGTSSAGTCAPWSARPGRRQ